jgi:hypothetical protein
MPASSVALIYSANTGRLRWFVNPDNDSDLARITPLPGEAMLTISLAQYLSAGSGLGGLQALVNSHTGSTPANDRYAVVDGGGNVVSALFVDPLIDRTPLPGQNFVAHSTAPPGAIYLGGVLILRTPLADQVARTRERTSALRR